MKSSLFLFTDTFPYGNKEQYLNEEFKLLESKFSDIYVIPVNVLGKKRAGFEHVNIIDLNQEILMKKLNFIKNLYKYFKLIQIDGSKVSVENLKSIHHAFESSEFIFDYIKRKSLDSGKITIYSYWFYHSALIAGFLNKKPTVINAVSRAHMGDVYSEIKTQKFIKLKLIFLDQILTISDHAKNYLSKQFPDYSNKLITSRLGVKDMGSNPSINNDQFFTIVTCSSITKRKRLDKIVDALKITPDHVKWVHFGDGDQMNDLRKSINDLPENIRVDLKGWVPNNMIQEYYKKNKVDLFVNISLHEGIPVSIMEAISFGIPVLAYNVYGIKEMGYYFLLNLG